MHRWSRSFAQRTGATKPPLPYPEGEQMLLRAHRAHEPSGNICLTKDGCVERETVHPVERCIAHQPAPGTFKPGSVVFEIQQLLRTGDGETAQILIGNAIKVDAILKLGNIEQRQVVAKVYDPLYENMNQDDFDPFARADNAYAVEVAVYTRLAKLQGKGIPKFFGSYSYKLQLPDGRSRAVRVILLELIPGQPMSDLKPSQFSQAQRQTIFQSIIDTETAIYTHNVKHNDLYPRNVIVYNDPLASSEPSTIILDFEHASLTRSCLMDPREEQRLLPGVPLSPLLRWHRTWMDDVIEEFFEGWIDWDWQPWLEKCYGATRSSITPEIDEIYGEAGIYPLPALDA